MEAGEEGDRFRELLDGISEAVDDAILSGGTGDYFLSLLLEIAIPEVRESGRAVFQNPLEEPVLYRHFKKSVRNSLDRLALTEKGMEDAIKTSGGG